MSQPQHGPALFLLQSGTAVLPPVNPMILQHLRSCQAVIYTMGSLYTSILPSLVLKGMVCGGGGWPGCGVRGPAGPAQGPWAVGRRGAEGWWCATLSLWASQANQQTPAARPQQVLWGPDYADNATAQVNTLEPSIPFCFGGGGVQYPNFYGTSPKQVIPPNNSSPPPTSFPPLVPGMGGGMGLCKHIKKLRKRHPGVLFLLSCSLCYRQRCGG